ncbi:MAG: hypothetical protein GTN60_03580 [Pseudomonas stutzeri]|nr:hypothetical protein [Stutzerimonas stutzeri]NIM53597.1 hypothetical protein [Stutzerimonas stutzeri]NIM85904.1 hypothetical protein [Stutzerimonas stutzeri]NIN80500.1 hypothetical protein [Stutzerimonas stutzeri]NIO99746.1 hypothetical protein [Stutzerimonas stutzeri]
MNFTTIQIIAFIGAVAGMAIVFGLGFYEGLRKGKREAFDIGYQRGLQAHRYELQQARREVDEAKHHLTISRLNAAQALEATTAELDDCREQIAKLQTRAITEDDATQLVTIADKLTLAANTFAGLDSHDQAQICHRLAGHARALFDRYWHNVPALQAEVMA